MDKMPLISIILYSVPEAFLFFIYGLILAGKKINIYRLMLSVIIFVSLSFFIRLLPLPYGFHIIISLLVLTMMFKFILALNFKKAIITTLISGGTLFALENSVMYLIQLGINMQLKEIWQYPIMRILIGWPHLLVWACITWLVWKKSIRLLQEV